MGTKVAPTYTALVLAYLERTLYEKVRQTFGNEAHDFVKENWKRFLDDCFIPWTARYATIDEFSLHPDLTFVQCTAQQAYHIWM